MAGGQARSVDVDGRIATIGIEVSIECGSLRPVLRSTPTDGLASTRRLRVLCRSGVVTRRLQRGCALSPPTRVGSTCGIAAPTVGCATVSLVPDACPPEAAPTDAADRDRVVTALDDALPGGSLDTSAPWADGSVTTLALAAALAPAEVLCPESPRFDETTRSSASVEITLADGRLDGAITAALTLGSFVAVTLETPPPSLGHTRHPRSGDAGRSAGPRHLAQ
jgi:hypothetical protein